MIAQTINNTHREIFQQPDVWRETYSIFVKEQNKIQAYVSKQMKQPDVKIMFTGAGTSAFIGNILANIYPTYGFTNCISVPTTDIITNPKAFFSQQEKLVLISFARSGNSPESMAAVALANKYCSTVSHIIITCNAAGQLATNVRPDDLLLLLPPETNDVSLAMTSSFSSMLLAALLLCNVSKLSAQQPAIDTLCANARQVLNQYEKAIQNISQRPFKRAVFLGSDELKGMAEECHLKLQELTDGAIICIFDSFMGFRHGPKAVINKETLLVYLFSDDDYVRQYEKDLVEQINGNNEVIAQIAVSQRKVDVPVAFDLEIETAPAFYMQGNPYSFIVHVFIGQLLGYFKSLNMGLNPDSPSVSGNIARVVEGVNIYELS